MKSFSWVAITLAYVLSSFASPPSVAQSSPLHSQPANGHSTNKALNAFYGICLANMADFERIVAMASSLGWRALPPEMKTAFAPAEKPEAFEAWLVTGDEKLFPKKTVAAVTKGSQEGKPAQTCTLAMVDIDGRALEDEFKSRMKPSFLGEDGDGMQHYRFYKINVMGTDQTVGFVLPADPSANGVTVSSFTPRP